jgi:hypothetical protein
MKVQIVFVDSITKTCDSFDLDVTEFTGEAVAKVIGDFDSLNYEIKSWVPHRDGITAGFMLVQTGELKHSDIDVSGFIVTGIVSNLDNEEQHDSPN